MPVDPGPSPWVLPDPRVAEAGEEVVAVGGELDPATVLHGYRVGLFPMHVPLDDHREVLGWWSPDPRGVLPLDGLRTSRSLRRSVRRFQVTVDTAFGEVMAGCADRGREHGWITDAFVDAYTTLHRLGWAHSVEVWHDDTLVGGLYGVEVGGLFAGESMFHRETDASKVALVHLVERLRAGGGDRLLDVQWRTDHLASLGVVEIPRGDYLDRLERALRLPPCL